MSTDERETGPETTYVGRYDPLELPIILEVLRENGIFAFTKVAPGEVEHEAYPFLNEGGKTLLVDSARVADAKRLIAETVPPLLEELRAGLASSGEPAAIDEDLVPFGWFEPAVAHILLEMLAQSDIKAVPEYSLDAPAPPYARTDGRVRVHVEELFLADAEDILETDVRETLAERGVPFTEPLRATDEP